MSTRAVFFEPDDARAVVESLLRDGFEAVLLREAFAGEDDDEDHAWSVTTDAPEVMLELLADAHDGWVDHDEPHTSVDPVALPSAPRRTHAVD